MSYTSAMAEFDVLVFVICMRSRGNKLPHSHLLREERGGRGSRTRKKEGDGGDRIKGLGGRRAEDRVRIDAIGPQGIHDSTQLNERLDA